MKQVSFGVKGGKDMKKLFYVIVASALAVVSCNKIDTPFQETEEMIEKSFTVISPDTKTALDGLHVRWSPTDKINVIAKTTGNQYTFSIESGAGSSSAVFTGSIAAADAAETVFYAVYPDVNVAVSGDNLVFQSSSSGDHKAYYKSGTKAKAVANGFDPSFAPMVAVSDASGVFSFSLGFSMFKFQVAEPDVKTIKFEVSGNTRLDGRPTLNPATGANVNVESAQKALTIEPESGVFATGTVYYLPFLTKAGQKIGNLTITYTKEDASTQSITTSSKSNDIPVTGKIYDLGTPPVVFPSVPTITIKKDAVTGIAAAAATGLTIAEAYTLANCVDSDVEVTYDGTVITAASISGGTVTYSISENTGTDDRDGWIGLNLAGEAVQTITVTQMKPVAALTPVTTTKTWDVANNFAPLASSLGTNAISTTFVDDNLQYVGGGKIKFNSAYLRFDGTGSATDKCVQFLIAGPGQLSVNAKSANATATNRSVKIALNGSVDTDVFTVPMGNDSAETHTWTITSANSGDLIAIFSGNSGINVYSITWTPD